MFASIIALGLLALGASANPFEAGASKNTPKASYMNKLMKGARATRRLDEEEYMVDISGYSVRFEKCQFVKSYDDELAEDADTGSVLATKRFIIFRLCPSDSCGYCEYNYGEYIVDMEEYLQATVQYQQELQEEMCQACEEACEQDEEEQGDDAQRRLRRLDEDEEEDYCESCTEECEKIENMEENGYIDASEYLECQQIQDADDDGEGLFAGPMCGSSGTKIKIGVFSDENCYYLDSSKDVEDYLVDGDGQAFKLSHALLKKTYDPENCVSCLFEEEEDENADEDENQNDEEEEPQVIEMCEQLYEASAKCETLHGFDEGYSNDDGYDNQLAQEEVVCDFISSLYAGTYDQEGEIVVGSGGVTTRDGGAATSKGQKFALAFFVLGTVGLAIYAAMLHSQLTKGAKADLSRQGGAMA